MNRLSPLIVRRAGPLAAAMPLPQARSLAEAAERPSSDDLKLFASSFLAGLVFFAAYLG